MARYNHFSFLGYVTSLASFAFAVAVVPVAVAAEEEAVTAEEGAVVAEGEAVAAEEEKEEEEAVEGSEGSKPARAYRKAQVKPSERPKRRMSGMCTSLYHLLKESWEVENAGWVGREKTTR